MGDIIDVVSSAGIKTALRNRGYGIIVDLLEEHPSGTLKVLLAEGAIKPYFFMDAIQAFHEGSDNLKVWSEYKIKIEAYLLSLDSDERFVTARKSITSEIHDKHFVRFPKWPAVGSEQTSSIVLNRIDMYDYTTLWSIAWCVEGSITVTDKHPKEKEYFAEVTGSPRFKFLLVNCNKLTQLNSLAAGNLAVAVKGIIAAQKNLPGSKCSWVRQ